MVDNDTEEIPDVEAALIDAGLEEILDSVEDAFGEELEFVADEFELLTGRRVFTRRDLTAIEAVVAADIERIGATALQAGFDIRSEVIRASLLGVEPDLESLEGLSDRMRNNIKTELNTSFAAFNRTMTIRKAIEEFGPNPSFLYIGPDDKRTREFCTRVLRDRNPAVYTLKEIQRLDNGQGLDVFSSGGGFNCRHDWRPFEGELKDELS